jgi:UDP-N-acetylglucosamine:LPS N-acetylglucosamine transferase
VLRNAAILVKDDAAQAELKKEILDLLANENKMTQLATNMAAMGFPSAAEAIAHEVFALVNEN